MKAINFFAVMSVVFFASSAAFAHPPSRIEASVDGEMLNVSITHNVKDRSKHYIEEVTVILNNKNLIDKKETQQLDNSKQVEVFEIPGLKAGDKIEIKAVCNRFGSKKFKLTVE